MKIQLNYFKLFLVLLFLGNGAISFASHVAGGTMTYRCLGNARYEITMEFRRDCINGDDIAPFDDPANFGVYDQNGFLVNNVFDGTTGQIGRFQVPLTTNDTLIETLTTECDVISGDVCVQVTVYRDTINLANIDGGYIIAYQRCCRNITLQNVEDPLETGATYWVRITEAALLECNTAPVWDAWPDIYICAEDTLDFFHSAFDPDGDSLVYELCVPSAGLNSTDNSWTIPPTNLVIPEVVFSNGYDLNNVFGAGDPLTIDPQTGRMFAVPFPIESQFLVGVCVKEYRNGVLLSEIRRDFEYNVRICGRAPIATAEPDAFMKCNSLEINFENNSTSNFQDFDSLDFTWIFDYPDNTFTSDAVAPSFTFPRSGNYTVALAVSDGTCVDTAFVEVSVATEDDPSLGFSLDAENCNPFTAIHLEANHSFRDSVPDDNYVWIITQVDGTMDTLSGRIVDYDLNGDQNVMIQLDVLGPTGCVSTTTQSRIVETTQNPIVDFDFNSYNCNSITSVDLFGEVVSTELVPDSTWQWIVTTSSGTTTINGADPTVDLGTELTQDVTVAFVVRTPNGCRDTMERSFTIDTAPDPILSLDFNANNCEGSTEVFLNGFASSNTQTIDQNSYSWTLIANNTTYNLQGANVSQDIITDQIVIVQLQVTTIEGCTTTISDTLQIVTIPFSPVFNDAVVCPGESAVVYTNTDPNTSVTVTPDNNLVVDANGNYLITNNTQSQAFTITVDNGDCTRIGQVNVNVDSNPSFAQLDDVIQCGDATVQLNPSGNTAYVYNWEGPSGVTFSQTAANPTVSLPVSGTFFVTISTSAFSDCLAYDTITVSRVELPTIDVLPSNEFIYCEGSDINLNATSSGDLTWKDPSGIVIGTGPGPINITGLTQSAVYTVEAVDRFGCFSAEQLEIQFIAAPTIPIDPVTQFQVCEGDSLTAVITTNNQITWTTANGLILSNTNVLSFPVLDQDTTVLITATNDLGCTSTQELTFTTFDLPEVSDEPLDFSICLDSEAVFELNSQDSVSWFDTDGNLITTGNELPLVGLEEATTYYIEYLNLNGCMSFDTLQVNVFDELGLQINLGAEEQIYCRGFSPEISSTFNVDSDITWTVNGMVVGTGSELLDYFPEGDVTLIALAEDDSGCMESDTIIITESFAEGTVSGPNTMCLGDEITLMYQPNGLSEYEITWTPDVNTDSIGTSIVASPEITTNYSVLYVNEDGCEDTTNFLVEVGGFAAAPQATTSKEEICLLESVDLNVTNTSGDNYIWTPANSLDDPTLTDPTATPEITTLYQVTITDDLGCSAESSVEVIVILPTCTEDDVFLPNMFTPNADMLNDTFKAESNFIESMTLTVYNRWGEEMFSTTDKDIGWDGTYQGAELAPDVYGYYFTAVCVNGFTYQKQGNVTLLK